MQVSDIEQHLGDLTLDSSGVVQNLIQLRFWTFDALGNKFHPSPGRLTVANNSTTTEVKERIQAAFFGRYPATCISLWKPVNEIPTEEGTAERTRDELFKAGGECLSAFCEKCQTLDGGNSLLTDRSTASPSPSSSLTSDAPSRRSQRIATRPIWIVVEFYDTERAISHVRLENRIGGVPAQVPPQNVGEATSMIMDVDKLVKASSRWLPSTMIQSDNYLAHQASPMAFLDGRYASIPKPVGVPVEVYHQSFARFSDTLKMPPSPSPDMILRTQAVMRTATRINSIEKSRVEETRKALCSLLGYPIARIVNLNGTAADHSATRSASADGNGKKISSGPDLLCVFEEKADMGKSGDAIVQAEFSYVQHWRDPIQNPTLRATFCPSFIVAISGPWFAVLGGIITNRVIVQHLTPYIWVGEDKRLNDEYVEYVAHVFTALGDAIRDLEGYYAGVKPTGKYEDSRFFPLSTSFPDPVNGSAREFRYIKFLQESDPLSGIFLATEKGKGHRMLVVKFVQRYGEEAHRILEMRERAPKLFYVGDVWSALGIGCGRVKMVVMEYVPGKTLDGVPSGPVHRAILNAMQDLHSRGIVHGDIRRPNILIADGKGDKDSRVRILDFDWAGRCGEARYPRHLSTSIPWGEGAGDLQLIMFEHDEHMVGQLLRNKM